MSQSRRLPPPRQLVRLYVADGMSTRQIADRYGIKQHKYVLATLRRDAATLGMPWPLKQNRPGWRARRAGKVSEVRHGAVKTMLLRMEIAEACQTYQIGVTELAERAGMSRSTLSKVTSGRATTTSRATAARIMEVIGELESGTIKPSKRPLSGRTKIGTNADRSCLTPTRSQGKVTAST